MDSKSLTTDLAKKAPRLGQGLYYDPLYGHIPTSGDLRQLIDLEVFQRLRGIKQLSTLYLVFPGAVHTRFEHSIGVSYLAQTVHQRLRSFLDYTPDPRLQSIQLDVVTLRAMELAALLHDIGHGPFGHVFEMFCRRNPKYQGWDHENWGKRLITGQDENGEFLSEEIYRQIPTFLADLQARLRSRCTDVRTLELLDPANIARLSMGEPPRLSDSELTNQYYFLKDLVPSAFGIDRLDYLRRDAFHTGVKTGDIDVGEIVGNLQLRIMDDGICRMYLAPSAGMAVESLIRSRDAVFRHLYHNAIHRSAQELLIRALLDLDEAPETLAFLSDQDLLDLFAQSGRPFLKEAEERIRFRILYEVHPLGSHEDIHPYESVIELYWSQSGGWRKFAGKEEEIGQKVGLSGAKRIFYDLERVPAIKAEDLEAKFFFDAESATERSLLELKPHMATLFEGTVFRGVNISKVHAYNDSVSQFFVAFPYDHLSPEIESLSEETDDAALSRRFEEVYAAKIEPIVNGFFTSVLGLSPREIERHKPVKALLSRAKLHFLHYLRDLVHIRESHVTGGEV